MVKYECFRCGYIASQRINLRHHLNRKNICIATEDDVEIEEIKKYYGFENTPILTQNDPKMTPNDPKMTPNETPNIDPKKPQMTHFVPKKTPKKPQKTPNEPICIYCNKSYSKMCHLRRHEKTCKKKKEAETLVINQTDKIMKMEKEIEELKIYKIQTQNNITNTNSNNTTNNIIINNYGDENLKHLRTKDFTGLLQGIYGAVPKLIKKIHFDPNHPENQNIKLPNKKYPYLKIMKNDKWELVNKRPELLDLIDSKYFILKERYYKILEKNKCNLSDLQKKKIDVFLDKYQEEDKDVILDLLNKTELVLLNNN